MPLPSHLPHKLSISCWIWSWIASATVREPYDDLDRCMIELKEHVLISGDFASHDYSMIPDNVQVFDQHIYAGIEWYFQDLYGRTVMNEKFDPHNPHCLEALRKVLGDDLVPWDEFMKPAANIRPFWRPIIWLFENLDNAKWDIWVAERFQQGSKRLGGR